MVNKPKIKGTAWETAIVGLLRMSGFPYAERRALTGTKDKGDITGLGFPAVIEAKNEKTITLAGYVAEVHAEMVNADADYGVAWIKRRGKTSPGDGYVVLDGWQWIRIMKVLRDAERISEEAQIELHDAQAPFTDAERAELESYGLQDDGQLPGQMAMIPAHVVWRRRQEAAGGAS